MKHKILRRTIPVFLTVCLAATAIAIPRVLSDWQDTKYLQTTGKMNMPEGSAEEGPTREEKLELLARLYTVGTEDGPRWYTDGGLELSPKETEPDTGAMGLDQAIERAQEELEMLCKMEIWPESSPLRRAQVEPRFYQIFLTDDPAKQINVWNLAFYWNDGDEKMQLVMDAEDGKIYSVWRENDWSVSSEKGDWSVEQYYNINTAEYFARNYHGLARNEKDMENVSLVGDKLERTEQFYLGNGMVSLFTTNRKEGEVSLSLCPEALMERMA